MVMNERSRKTQLSASDVQTIARVRNLTVINRVMHAEIKSSCREVWQWPVASAKRLAKQLGGRFCALCSDDSADSVADGQDIARCHALACGVKGVKSVKRGNRIH